MKPVINRNAMEQVEIIATDSERLRIQDVEARWNREDPWAVLFPPVDGAMIDYSDGVTRCGMCSWEVLNGVCSNCGRRYFDSNARGPGGSDNEDIGVFGDADDDGDDEEGGGEGRDFEYPNHFVHDEAIEDQAEEDEEEDDDDDGDSTSSRLDNRNQSRGNPIRTEILEDEWEDDGFVCNDDEMSYESVSGASDSDDDERESKLSILPRKQKPSSTRSAKGRVLSSNSSQSSRSKKRSINDDDDDEAGSSGEEDRRKGKNRRMETEVTEFRAKMREIAQVGRRSRHIVVSDDEQVVSATSPSFRDASDLSRDTQRANSEDPRGVGRAGDAAIRRDILRIHAGAENGEVNQGSNVHDGEEDRENNGHSSDTGSDIFESPIPSPSLRPNEMRTADATPQATPPHRSTPDEFDSKYTTIRVGTLAHKQKHSSEPAGVSDNEDESKWSTEPEQEEERIPSTLDNHKHSRLTSVPALAAASTTTTSGTTEAAGDLDETGLSTRKREKTLKRKLAKALKRQNKKKLRTE